MGSNKAQRDARSKSNSSGTLLFFELRKLLFIVPASAAKDSDFTLLASDLSFLIGLLTGLPKIP